LGVLGLISVGRFWNWLRGRQPLFPSKKVLGLVLLFGFLLLIGFYMSLLKSQWLWDQIFLLKYAQFPWRWLSIIILLIALLIGSLTWFIKNKLTRVYGSLLLVIIMVIGSVTYFRPEKFLERNEDYYYTDPLLMRKNLSNILPDYAVVGMPIPPTLIPEELIINSQELPADSFEILVERVHEKLIKTNFTSEATLELAVADYPGWGLEIDNQRWNRQIGENGNISVTVPAGQHLVALRFLSTPVRKYADLLSLFSWLILVFLLIPKKQLNSLNLKKKNKS